MKLCKNADKAALIYNSKGKHKNLEMENGKLALGNGEWELRKGKCEWGNGKWELGNGKAGVAVAQGVCARK